MPRVNIDGVDIYFESYGTPERPTVFLSYCLGGNLTFLRPQAEKLSARFRVVLWDARGHGQSESPADAKAYGISRSANDLAGLLDHFGLEKAHVGGLSMGGGIAARFAQLHPARALSLMILDSNTAAAQPVNDRMREVRTHTAELCDQGKMDEAAEYYLANSPPYKLFAGDTPDNRARLHHMVASNNPFGFASTLRAMLEPDSKPEDLALITAPTLLVAGEHDPAMAVIKLTEEKLANAAFRLIPGAGHLSNIDAPEQFLDEVSAFLESHREAS